MQVAFKGRARQATESLSEASWHIRIEPAVGVPKTAGSFHITMSPSQ